MKQTYAIIMFIVAGILFLYSIPLIYTGNDRYLLFRRADRRIPRRRVRMIGESTAFAGYAPLLSGIVSLVVPFDSTPWPSLAVMAAVGAAVAFLRWRAFKKEKKRSVRRKRL